jgi:hypothetical protein
MTYSDKLRDPRWQKKRLEILERDGWACTCCEEPRKTLHVHHKKYNSNPWDADDNDLVTLCEGCHKDLTGRIASLKGVIPLLDIGSVAVVAGFAKALIQSEQCVDVNLINAEEIDGFAQFHEVHPRKIEAIFYGRGGPWGPISFSEMFDQIQRPK